MKAGPEGVMCNSPLTPPIKKSEKRLCYFYVFCRSKGKKSAALGFSVPLVSYLLSKSSVAIIILPYN